MGWRQVVLLYGVLAVLGAEYWLVERRKPPAAEARPVRPRFIPVQPGDIREVRLLRGGRTVVSRRDDGGWTVVEPAGAPIAPDLIAAFTTALAEAEEIARIGTADADPQIYGLDERGARIEMVPVTGDRVEVTIGETNPTGTAVYARRRGSPDVVLIGRNVRYYEDLIFQALSAERAPVPDSGAPIGG